MASRPGARRARAAGPKPGGRRSAEQPLRPHYGRILAFTSAAAVTAVAVLGEIGFVGDQGIIQAAQQTSLTTAVVDSESAGEAVPTLDSSADKQAWGSKNNAPVQAADKANTSSRSRNSNRANGSDSAATPDRSEQKAPSAPAPGDDTTQPDQGLPADSGSGRRVVFSIGQQRVWLVNDDNEIERTYLGSGSLSDNLKAGSYEVYSRSRYAVGIDDSGTMQYFVRFARGERAAIGFHSIPYKDGKPLQTRAQLGTPQSHGCIRQAAPDAVAMWDFAQQGTSVVVTDA